MESILSTRGVLKRFGAFRAVDGVDLDVRENETVGIIGPNGAGKTTFLNLLTGRYVPEEGTVYFRAADVTRQRPEHRVASGVLRTFQIVHVFDDLTVHENMALSYYRKRERSSLPISMYFTNLFKQRDILEAVEKSLETFELSPSRDVMVRSLSLGSKKKLEIAIAWVADPDVLILDEPFAGIGDQEIDGLLAVLQRIRHHKTIILVEHKVSKLSGLVDKLAVMHDGKFIAVGPFETTINDPAVRESYWKIGCEEGETQRDVQEIMLQKTTSSRAATRDPGAAAAQDLLLEVRGVSVAYGDLEVVFDVSAHVRGGEVVVLAGRNGAGKTTLMRTIAGFLPKRHGTVGFRGQDITSLPPYRVAQAGVKYIHQDKTVFGSLTVKENFALSSYATGDDNLEEVLPYFPRLRTLMDRRAEALSGGERQMLLMAMALLGNPALVLMDEPTEGLAPHVIEDLAAIFLQLKKKTTLFIVEQNLPLVARVADRVYAMKEGKIVAEITDPQEICNLAFEEHL